MGIILLLILVIAVVVGTILGGLIGLAIGIASTSSPATYSLYGSGGGALCGLFVAGVIIRRALRDFHRWSR